MQSKGGDINGDSGEDTPVALNFTVEVDGKSYTVTDAASPTTVVKEKFGNGLGSALTKDEILTACQNLSISVKCTTSITYTFNLKNGNTSVVHNLTELKNFLKGLGVPDAETSAITEYPECTSYDSAILWAWID